MRGGVSLRVWRLPRGKVAAARVEGFETPRWVYDTIFYHIFPERFCNGDPSNDPPGTVPWGSRPTFDNFMGGDLQGVMDRLDYLKELGVGALYLNPIFKARSNHKFDHGDYLVVDPHFGTNELMRRLVDEAHQRGIRIILDISHNHSGREFYAFADVVEKGELSPYKDWYHFYSFPVSGPENPNYKGWWGLGSLPEFNNDHPGVQEYFWNVTRYWMQEIGIDGWRLDVANEVPHHYWEKWRELVKSINPDAYTVGEIWGDGTPWLQGNNFDAVMNYVFRDHVIHFFAERKTPPSRFHQEITALLSRHPTTVNLAMFNLLGSHDTPRILTVAGGDVARVKLAMAFQMTYVGAPVIYYGDEIGMSGGKDPECRGAFPWDPGLWNVEIYEWAKLLTRLRRSEPALRSPEYQGVITDDHTGVYAYRRGMGRSAIYVALNNSEQTASVELPVGEWERQVEATDLVDLSTYPIVDGMVGLTLAPAQAVILKPSH